MLMRYTRLERRRLAQNLGISPDQKLILSLPRLRNTTRKLACARLSMGRVMAKEYFDLLVIIPLEEELLAFGEVFEHDEDRSTDTQYRWTYKTGREDLRMLVVQQEDMGRQSAGKATYELLQEYDVGLVVCLGIAGSLAKDARLGDVCYTGHVIDVYDNAKTTDAGEGSDAGVEIAFSPSSYETRRDITTALNFARTQPTLRAAHQQWVEERGKLAEEIVPDPVPGRAPGKTELVREPRSKDGTIVCGMVSNAKNYNNRLRALDRKVLAIETESGSVFSHSRDRGVQALTIRGISDYAKDKVELEEASDNRVRELAAGNAATFLRMQFLNDRFVSLIKNFEAQSTLNLPATTDAEPTPTCTLGELLERLDLQITDKLRELSPEFRLQEKGYRLPIPRVREAQDASQALEFSLNDPVEVREAVAAHSVVLMSLPTTYPDKSLAWVIADDLLTAELDGKQVLPIVIDGRELGPPNNGIWSQSKEVKQAEVDSLDGVQPVFIIDNPPAASRTKTRFIKQQMNALPEARFIFVDRNGANALREGEFIISSGAKEFSTCDVSFVEIAHFVQKNFDMSGNQAEVIAYRLRQTFRDFNLSTHPTFFAGIPRETLSALLQANRRSELIQLAVDGFLTFVVASDKSDVSLSRTTRARFLRKLAVEIKVNKRSYTQDELIRFTSEFAVEKDYAIDPIQFVQSFVEKGLLHFDENIVRITLPFIESYLLAYELSRNEDLAKLYFDINNPSSIDLLTFDLYCEIGASPALVHQIMNALEQNAEDIDTKKPHILLGSEVNPRLLSRLGKASLMQNRIANAVTAVKEQKSDARDKQKLLDAADRVRDETSRRSDEVGEKDPALQKMIDEVDRLGSVWLVGTTLLGAGAEHIDATEKRRLASLLIAIAGQLVEEWTKLHLSIDYAKMKADMLNGEAKTALMNIGFSEQETEQLIDFLVDAFEMKALADPLRRVLYHLCETARHKVLAVSVASVKPDALFDRIVHGTWWTDIDASGGRTALKATIKDLPAAPMLRNSLVTHFLARAYWSHPNPDDRLTLLDCADEVVKPLDRTLDKGKLKRLFTAPAAPEDDIDRPVEGLPGDTKRSNLTNR